MKFDTEVTSTDVGNTNLAALLVHPPPTKQCRPTSVRSIRPRAVSIAGRVCVSRNPIDQPSCQQALASFNDNERQASFNLTSHGALLFSNTSLQRCMQRCNDVESAPSRCIIALIAVQCSRGRVAAMMQRRNETNAPRGPLITGARPRRSSSSIFSCRGFEGGMLQRIPGPPHEPSCHSWSFIVTNSACRTATRSRHQLAARFLSRSCGGIVNETNPRRNNRHRRGRRQAIHYF
jgi:hypothetical protein